MEKCLYCYKPLKPGQTDFHPACARKLFGKKEAPVLPYTRAEIADLAKQVIRAQTTLTGVQAKLSGAEAISLTMPLREEPYKDKVLFPFFDGLIPEGWLLGIAERSWKINQRDRMSLLLACCKDCIGAVSVVPYEEDNNP